MRDLLFAPARGLLGRLLDAGLPVSAADLRLEPSRHAGEAGWTSAVLLRLARGDRAAARALADDVALGDDVRAGDDGLLHLRPAGPPEPAGEGWARAALADGGCTPPALPVRARRLDDAGYRAMLAHARLRTVRGPAPREVQVVAADARRVADRVRLEGRAHHLVDWVAAAGAVVVPWSEDWPHAADGAPADIATGLRTDLASALRAVGLTPTERL